MTTGPVKSARRVLELLEMYAAVQHPLTVTEISRHMEMPQSSTSEMLQSLVSMGYLDHDTNARTYYPTIRVSLLGTWIGMRDQRAGRMPAIVSRMTEKTGETVLLTMRNGIFSQIILGQDHNTPQLMAVETRNTNPLACCASGWSLLANKSDEEIGKIIRRTTSEVENPHWRKTAPDALDGARNYRKNGYAQTRGHSKPDSAGIAIRLPDTDQRMEFAISVVGPVSNIEEKKNSILDALRDLMQDLKDPASTRELAKFRPPELKNDD